MNKVPLIKLSEVSNIVMGQSPSSNFVYDDLHHGMAFLQGSAEFGKKYPIPLKSCSNGPKKASQFSTLISVRAPVGDTNIADKDYIIGRGLASVVAKGIDANYLSFAINFAKKDLQRVSQGSTFTAIGSKELNELMIPIFELNEQKKIAQILISIDEQIDLTEKLIKKKSDIKKGLMHDLFDVTNFGCLRKSLIEMAEYINGYAFSPHQLEKSGTPVVRIEQLNNPNGYYDFTNTDVPLRNHIKTGDLIFSWSGTLKIVEWKHGDAVLNQHLFKVVPFSGIDKHFLLHLVDHKMEDLMKMSHGSTMKHIQRGELENFKVAVPDLNIQIKQAEIINLSTLDIENNISLLEKLKQKKHGLIQDLLTGQIRVN